MSGRSKEYREEQIKRTQLILDELHRPDPNTDPAHDPKVLRAGIERIRDNCKTQFDMAQRAGVRTLSVETVDLCTKLLAGEAIE